MKLAEATWAEVDEFTREALVVIPTGSLEQHGRHLPLFTDSMIVTAVGAAVEAARPGTIILTPTLWLGASGHHLAFAGSLSASFEGYIAAITAVVESLVPHGFRKFYVLNGHGGNAEPNGIAMRSLRSAHPTAILGHGSYYTFCEATIAEVLTGPLKQMRHACEAETSLMMHLHPDLVRTSLLRDDGLVASPPVRGVIHHFDEMTEAGSFGYATQGTPEKGARIFNSAVAGVVSEFDAIVSGYVLQGLGASE